MAADEVKLRCYGAAGALGGEDEGVVPETRAAELKFLRGPCADAHGSHGGVHTAKT
jgi:hypothetical protein